MGRFEQAIQQIAEGEPPFEDMRGVVGVLAVLNAIGGCLAESETARYTKLNGTPIAPSVSVIRDALVSFGSTTNTALEAVVLRQADNPSDNFEVDVAHLSASMYLNLVSYQVALRGLAHEVSDSDQVQFLVDMIQRIGAIKKHVKGIVDGKIAEKSAD